MENLLTIIKLSHTAKELYLVSPRAYYYKYLLNLKEKTTSSPLFFGSAIDNGINALLSGAKLDDAILAFKTNFKTTKVNGKFEDLTTSPNIKYFKSDLDESVFTEKELKDLDGKSDKFKSWASLVKKGEMLLTAYSQDILPNIKKVIEVQKYFSIPNDANDEIIGFADLICELKDGRLVILDNKTSSSAYKDDAVTNFDTGKQTALYFEAFKHKYTLDAAGFLVLEKKIRKKDPRVRTQIIIDTPPEEIIQKTFDEFDEVLHNIKQGHFECNSPKCDQYGQECCYKKYCQSNGKDLSGLIKLKKE